MVAGDGEQVFHVQLVVVGGSEGGVVGKRRG